ncbi:MAG: hypothetical protein HOV83_08970, partial [Catenulispora sp.]|nr:hypothetical protein [Catenulispora sp.]
MKSFVRRRGWILAAALTMGLLAAPLTSSAAVSSQAETTDQVRTRLLGEGWNQPEVVRARWISNTTYLISYGGNVILHDTTIPQNLLSSTESNGYVTMDDIIAAQPEAILQDHDHFDQNRDAAQIASATGAPLVTTVTGCLAVKQDALVKGINPDTIHCDLLRDASGNAFTALDSFFLPYGG